MQRVRLRRTALRATPRMNTSTQRPEGAGESRSKAAGELTLGLLSGEELGCTPIHCRSEPARDGALTDDQSFPDLRSPTEGARLARDDALTADQSLPDIRSPTVGARLARDDGLTANQSLPDVPNPNCGSQPAGDGALPANQFLPDIPDPTVVTSKLLRRSDDYGLTANTVYHSIKHSDLSHKIFRLSVGSAISSL
ncbi:hypothetical protein D3C87_1140370 [compost metagenome]